MLRFCVFAKIGKNLSRYTWKKRGKIIINTYICDVLVIAFYIWLNCLNILQSCLVLISWLSVCEFFCGQERKAVRILVSKQKYIRNTFLCHSSSHLDQPTRPWVLASSTGQRKEMCSKTSCTSVPFHSSCWVRLRWHKENSPVPLTLPAWAAQAKAWITAPSNCIAEGSSLRISILTLTIQISPDLAISCLSSFMCSSALQGTP